MGTFTLQNKPLILRLYLIDYIEPVFSEALGTNPLILEYIRSPTNKTSN
jgi:hypothetical protein